MKTTKTYTGQATDDQIAEWKKEHGKIFGIACTGHIAYFRKPDMDDLNIAAAESDLDTPLEYNRSVMNGCIIGGSREIIDNNDVYLAASKKFNKIIDAEKAELVEL